MDTLVTFVANAQQHETLGKYESVGQIERLLQTPQYETLLRCVERADGEQVAKRQRTNDL